MFLNRYFPTIPPGTLAANLIGCYIIGMAVAFFTAYPAFAPEWRLVRDDGILRRFDHLLDLLRRNRDAAAIGRSIWALGAVAAHCSAPC